MVESRYLTLGCSLQHLFGLFVAGKKVRHKENSRTVSVSCCSAQRVQSLIGEFRSSEPDDWFAALGGPRSHDRIIKTVRAEQEVQQGERIVLYFL